jgi:hypothetical protein
MDQNDPLAPYGVPSRPASRQLTQSQQDALANVLAIAIGIGAVVGGVKLVGALAKAIK